MERTLLRAQDFRKQLGKAICLQGQFRTDDRIGRKVNGKEGHFRHPGYIIIRLIFIRIQTQLIGGLHGLVICFRSQAFRNCRIIPGKDIHVRNIVGTQKHSRESIREHCRRRQPAVFSIICIQEKRQLHVIRDHGSKVFSQQLQKTCLAGIITVIHGQRFIRHIIGPDRQKVVSI